MLLLLDVCVSGNLAHCFCFFQAMSIVTKDWTLFAGCRLQIGSIRLSEAFYIQGYAIAITTPSVCKFG